MAYQVQYAISLGIKEQSGLWLLQFIHPLDAMQKVSAWLPLTADDESIGKTIDGIKVAKPDAKMAEVLGWLTQRLNNYPYYWPYEGHPVDKYSYDFTVNMDKNTANSVGDVEINDIAYNIVKQNLSITAPPAGPQVVSQDIYTMPSGGALIKYTVTLQTAQPVSEITITPFSEFALEVESITYEEDVETFHERKELIPQTVTVADGKTYSSPTEPQASTNTMTFSFPAVIAKRFTFILRQKNYKKDTYLIREKDLNEKDLWDKITEREAEVTLDVTDGLDTVETDKIDKWTGWDIYLQQLQKYYEALEKWKQDMIIYRQKQAEREAAIQLQQQYDNQYNQAMDQYRADYAAAVSQYNQQVANYKQQLTNYNNAKANYDRNLALYNKYLQDLKAWQAKWG